MSTDAVRTARELQMLEAMVDCAHALGVALGEAAKAEADTKRSLELLDAFHKSFLAVRMGIRLSMTLRAPPKVAQAVASERAEAPEPEPAEHDPPERVDSAERERDRDYEAVSLPKFLATLGLVARDAGRLNDRLPPDAVRALPTLQGLLARAESDAPTAEPAPSRTRGQTSGVAVLVRAPQGGTRRKLLGSAATPRPGPRPPPPWAGSG